jgi:hypothetical protein
MPLHRKDDKVNQLLNNLASLITKAASKQTYNTIRFLADRERVDDAYQTYGYFRWVDDILDAVLGVVIILLTSIAQAGYAHKRLPSDWSSLWA